MRQMEKPFFIRRNKLVRTSTFTATLLIATILLISSVVPAAIQVNNNNELRTKGNDVEVQKSSQLVTNIKAADRTISIGKSPSRVPINNEVNGNLMDLWDNGLPDEQNGLSCGIFSGLTREVCDDFLAGGVWMVDGGEFRFVTYYGYGPEAISGVSVMFYNDIGGVPETVPFATLTATYSGVLTGDYYFGRPETLMTFSFDLTVLNPGTYWVDILPTASDNIFWLTSAGYGSEVYLSYPDLGYAKWTAGHIVFGSYFYGVSFKLTGNLAGVEHDVSVNSIDSPVSGGAGESFIPKINVGNNGNQTENDVPIEMTIDYWVPPTGSTYMNEEFNSWMPTGWTQDTYNYAWASWYSNYAGGTYPEAVLDYSYIYTSPCWLMSPAISTSTATTLHLSFRTWIYDYYGTLYPYSCKVWVQSGSGDWTDMTPWANPITGDIGPALYDFDITSKKGTGTQVMFEFTGDPWGINYWFLDNVQFYLPGVPGHYENEYDEILYVDIPKDGLIDVTFPAWEPEGWQVVQGQDIHYQINAWTDLLLDEIPSNDFKTKDIILSYPFLHDIAVTSINSPIEDGPAKTLPVGCTIKNVGQNEECCYQTSMVIGKQQVVGTAMSQDFSSGLMPPTGWTDEIKNAGWYGWYISYSQQSGGTSPEAYLYYYYCWADYKLYSNAFDTSAYAGVVLEFKSYIDHFSGQGLYVLNAVASTDNGATWSTVWSYAPSSDGQFEVSVPIPGGSTQTRIGFVVTGDPWYFDYWYLDDIEVKGVEVIPEYTAAFCTIELSPGESMDLDFDDWTPAALELGVTDSIDYIVVAEQQLPSDTNPTNDKLSDGFTLDYWHDVKVKGITGPSLGRSPDVFYAFEAYPLEESFWFESTTPGDINIIGPSTAPDFISAGTWAEGTWYVSPYNTGALYTVDIDNGAMTLIGGSVAGGYTGIAYDDITGTMYGITWSGSAAELYTIDLGTGASTHVGSCGYYLFIDMAIDKAGICYGHDIIGDSIYTIDLSSAAVTLVGSTGISCNYAQGMAYDKNNEILYLAAYTYQGELYTVDVTTGHATLVGVFEGGIEVDGFAIPYESGPPGPAKIEVWVPLNSEESIAATVQNLGTFVENDLTCYANLYDYIQDPENATEVYNNSIANIDLDVPLGGEENLIFGDYTFTAQGIYTLIINIPLGIDDSQNNNIKKLGIGCDNTGPSSTHTLSPATPTGLNGWYVNDLTVTLDATDGTQEWQSGVQEIVYKVNGVQKTISGKHGTFKIEDDGENIAVEYWAIDKVGNQESAHHTFTVDMDQTKPTISLVYEVTGGSPITGYEFTFTATSTDETSSMERVDFYLNSLFEVSVTGSGPTYQWIVELGNVPHVIIRGIAYDMAGNNDFDEIEDPTPHSNEQSLPQSATQTTIKINLGR